MMASTPLDRQIAYTTPVTPLTTVAWPLGQFARLRTEPSTAEMDTTWLKHAAYTVPEVGSVDRPLGKFNALRTFPAARVETLGGDVPIESTMLLPTQAATTPTEATLTAMLGLTPASSEVHCSFDAIVVTVEPTTDMTPPPLQPMYTTPLALSTATLFGVHELGMDTVVIAEQLHGAVRAAGPSAVQFSPPKRGAGLVQVRVCVCVHLSDEEAAQVPACQDA